MAKTIVQTVDFNVAPSVLYSLYADSRKHSAATGAKAEISGNDGGRCDAFDGSLTGIRLGAIRNRLFVQTWRADDWTSDQPDSVLTLFFETHRKGARLTMVHANIPDEHYAGLKTGWTSFYWTPWKRYLAAKTSGRKLKRA